MPTTLKTADGSPDAVEIRHVSHEALAAFRALAASRALVAEKDKALEKIYSETENVRMPLANWMNAVIRAAISLTEADMLEAKE